MARGYKKNNLSKARNTQHCHTDSETSDCGYTGGIENDPSSDSDSLLFLASYGSSDEESLAELEGDELENNLQTLRQLEGEESEVTERQTLYSKIVTHKTSKDWERAEKVRWLEYNKQSICTQERRRKQQRDWKVFSEKARALWVEWYLMFRKVQTYPQQSQWQSTSCNDVENVFIEDSEYKYSACRTNHTSHTIICWSCQLLFWWKQFWRWHRFRLWVWQRTKWCAATT